MWSLKPFVSPPSTCPKCGNANPGFNEYKFSGLHLLGMGTCINCGVFYYHTWPLGHDEDYPIAFTENGVASFEKQAEQWLARPLIRTIKQDLSIDVPVDRQINRSISKVLLLNCLDPCYGHVLWKLFNIDLYHETEPDQGLVVLVPENCVWLVPEHVAEIWSVPIRLRDLHLQIGTIENFIHKVSNDFDSIKLLPVFTHLDHAKIDLTSFLSEIPFELDQFQSRKPTVTFIWREDRLWLRSKFEEWLDLFSRKISVDWIRRWLVGKQLKRFIRLAQLLRQERPGLKLSVTGLGKYGKMPDFIEDDRQVSMSVDKERHWCGIYASSHLVVGIHGSNMLIPSALSAGFVELIPKSKLRFLSEDILLKHTPRFQTFLGRHLSSFSSPKMVAAHINSIFSDFGYLYKNTNAKL